MDTSYRNIAGYKRSFSSSSLQQPSEKIPRVDNQKGFEITEKDIMDFIKNNNDLSIQFDEVKNYLVNNPSNLRNKSKLLFRFRSYFKDVNLGKKFLFLLSNFAISEDKKSLGNSLNSDKINKVNKAANLFIKKISQKIYETDYFKIDIETHESLRTAFNDLNRLNKIFYCYFFVILLEKEGNYTEANKYLSLLESLNITSDLESKYLIGRHLGFTENTSPSLEAICTNNTLDDLEKTNHSDLLRIEQLKMNTCSGNLIPIFDFAINKNIISYLKFSEQRLIIGYVSKLARKLIGKETLYVSAKYSKHIRISYNSPFKPLFLMCPTLEIIFLPYVSTMFLWQFAQKLKNEIHIKALEFTIVINIFFKGRKFWESCGTDYLSSIIENQQKIKSLKLLAGVDPIRDDIVKYSDACELYDMTNEIAIIRKNVANNGMPNLETLEIAIHTDQGIKDLAYIIQKCNNLKHIYLTTNFSNTVARLFKLCPVNVIAKLDTLHINGDLGVIERYTEKELDELRDYVEKQIEGIEFKIRDFKLSYHSENKLKLFFNSDLSLVPAIMKNELLESLSLPRLPASIYTNTHYSKLMENLLNLLGNLKHLKQFEPGFHIEDEHVHKLFDGLVNSECKLEVLNLYFECNKAEPIFKYLQSESYHLYNCKDLILDGIPVNTIEESTSLKEIFSRQNYFGRLKNFKMAIIINGIEGHQDEQEEIFSELENTLREKYPHLYQDNTNLIELW